MNDSGEMKMSNETKIYKPKRPMSEHILINIISYTLLAFCIWISQGSTLWTFLTGLLFLIGFFSAIWGWVAKHSDTFTTKKELLEWANSLPDDDDH